MVKKTGAIFFLFLEILLGSVATIASLLIFLKLTGEIMEKEVFPIDSQILAFFYHARTPLLTTFMVSITNLGGGVMIGLAVFVMIVFLIKKYFKEALIFAFLFCMSGINNVLLKNLIKRNRPHYHPLIIEKDYSFPSGHAMNSFVFYFTLSYLLFHITKNKKLSIGVACLSACLVFLIGVSRIYLGVHYPSDVVGGYVGGFVWFVSVLFIQKTLAVYKVFQVRNS